MSDGMVGHQELSIFLSEILQPSKIIISVPLVALIPTLKLNERLHVVMYYMVIMFSFNRAYMMVITCKLTKWKWLVQLQNKTIPARLVCQERSSRRAARPPARIARRTRTRMQRAGPRRACLVRRTRCLCPAARRSNTASASPDTHMRQE